MNKTSMRNDQTVILKLERFISPHQTQARPADETITSLAVRAAHDASAGPVVQPGGSADAFTSANTILGMVTYCYAKGVYGSTDIERKLRSAHASGGYGLQFPDATWIRRFRRLNRSLIQAALERTFQLIGRSNAAASEAAERLDTAALLDSIADD